MTLISSYKTANEHRWSDSMFNTGMASDAIKDWTDLPDAHINLSLLVNPQFKRIKYGILNERLVISARFEIAVLPPQRDLTALFSFPYKIKTGEGGSTVLMDVKNGVTTDAILAHGSLQHVLDKDGVLYWFSWRGAGTPSGDTTCELYCDGVIHGETTPVVFQ